MITKSGKLGTSGYSITMSFGLLGSSATTAPFAGGFPFASFLGSTFLLSLLVACAGAVFCCFY